MKFIAREGDREVVVEVVRHGAGYEVTIGSETIVADLVSAGEHLRSLRVAGGRQFAFSHHRTGDLHEIAIDGVKRSIEIIDPLALRRGGHVETAGEAGTVKALMPGRIVRVSVTEGDAVPRGAGLLVLEAMKMENEIQAPVAGTIESVFVKVGDTVEAGAPLVHIV